MIPAASIRQSAALFSPPQSDERYRAERMLFVKTGRFCNMSINTVN